MVESRILAHLNQNGETLENHPRRVLTAAENLAVAEGAARIGLSHVLRGIQQTPDSFAALVLMRKQGVNIQSTLKTAEEIDRREAAHKASFIQTPVEIVARALMEADAERLSGLNTQHLLIGSLMYAEHRYELGFSESGLSAAETKLWIAHWLWGS